MGSKTGLSSGPVRGHDTDFYVEALGCTIVFMGGEG